MKRPLLLLLPLLMFAVTLHAGPREAQWKRIEKLMEKQLPESAAEALVKMEAAARAANDWPEAARAVATRVLIVSEAEIRAERPEGRVARMEEEIAKAPPEMLPVLHTMQAEWIHDYFRRNDWKIMERTPGAAGADMATWDVRRLLAEMDARFTRALSHTEELRRTPIAQWGALLPPGKLPDHYLPTLYDFLAGEALTFYSMAEQVARPENAYDLDAASPALGSMEEFLSWDVPAGEDSNIKALRLYKEVMVFHRADANPAALVTLDLQRLEWVRGVLGEPADARVLEQYTALYQKHAAHEVSLRARSLAAHVLQDGRKPAEARRILREGLQAHPKSLFAPRCRNQIRDIERRELSISTELIWNAAQPEIEFEHRNLKQAFLRLYLVAEQPDPASAINERYPDRKQVQLMLREKPLRAWQVELPPADDYLGHRHRVPAPLDLKPGYYLLCASGNAAFTAKDNQVSTAHVWVTPLSLVTRGRRTRDVATLDAWVLDAVTGEPLQGAEVTLWGAGEKNTWIADGTATTGGDGFVCFQPKDGKDCYLFAKHGGHMVLSQRLRGNATRINDDKTRSFLFTDRAIYRPGQTIQFKGIHVHEDRDLSDYRVLAGVERRVILLDPNHLEVAAVDVVTNDYGSYSGSFTAPRQELNGEYSIFDGGWETNVRVEEYKRPKFRVEVDPPLAVPKLGEPVTVKVKALAYTGAPVDGAIVQWYVEREAYWPSWSSYRPSYNKPIRRGTATTAADGTAEMKFTAVPDKSVPETGEVWFTFNIHADVTDPAGETRSANRSVTAGYVAMQAELTTSEWQTVAAPVEIIVSTTTLDGEPRAAEGTLTVHHLVKPERVHRKRAGASNYPMSRFPITTPHFDGSLEAPEPDFSEPVNWPTGEVAHHDDFKTGAKGDAKVNVKLPAGAYRALLESKDRAGRTITARREIIVVDPAVKTFPVRVPCWLEAPAWTVEPGADFIALWGTGYDQGRAFIEIEQRHQIVQRFWTDAGRTQQGVTFKVTEAHRGGFILHVTQMRENRLSTSSQFVDVPWSNKDLTMKWEHFTSKLDAGAKDTWTLTVEGPNREKAAAEMAAVLYDASLDALKEHSWPPHFDGFYSASWPYDHLGTVNGEFTSFTSLGSNWWGTREEELEDARTWAWVVARGDSRYFRYKLAGGGFQDMKLTRSFVEDFDPPQIPQTFGGGGSLLGGASTALSFPVTPTTPVALSAYRGVEAPQGPKHASARKNFAETAFFYPHLLAEDGKVKLEFTMPEAVTTWKFLGFAHDKEMRSGLLSGETITARELMVQPNPPRFLREGDTVEFTVKITNQSDATQSGDAQLSFKDAVTLAPADTALHNAMAKRPFTVPAKESRTLSWRITVPDGQGFLTWKAVAVTERMSDGEEGWLPVLSRRIPVTESLAMPLRDAGTKEFAFKKLQESAGSNTLRHQSLTVQMTSQPAWYAVMALPYLMEFPHECSEQTFNRFYANTLASHIANSDPNIRRVFNLWRDAQPDALKSPLERNADLKSLMIEETPWLREPQEESKRSLGILFDENRLSSEAYRVLRKLAEMQLQDGAWPWFPGGPPSEFITLYVVAGFGRLKHLGVEVDTSLAEKALTGLDTWLEREHQAARKADRARKDAKTGDHLTSAIALYLYGRSFFLDPEDREPQKPALKFFMDQARRHWTTLPRMSQAHVALGLHRFGDAKTAAAILASLKELSISSEELGRHWPTERESWSWNQAPVESQALMIEAFREIAHDAQMVEDCQVWLLRQKQTNAWPTTKATADAAAALLLGGTDKLSSDALVTVSLGGAEVKPEKVEAGTGFFGKRFAPGEIKPEMGAVKLVKTDAGIAWGSLHWQYTEVLDKITPHEGTPLKVTKSLFTKVQTPAGAELRPVTGKVKVGDELVVRLELRTDRDMEFVHLKDQRPSSVEPVNVLSGYRWRDSLGYYESTRDTASHFFFDSLPKGTCVFEYSARVQLRGACQSGVADLQCMYAPEFSSHSASTLLEVE